MGKLQVNGDIKASGTISSGNGQLVMSTSGSLVTYLTTTGGWARGWSFQVNDTNMQGFGFYGNGSTKINHFYIGAYDAAWMKVTPNGTVTATKFVGSLQGNADTASILSIHNNLTNTSTRSTSASGWDGGVSGLQYVWGQSFKDTSIGSDTGDLVLGLRAGQYTSGGTELCMMIDGDYYSLGKKVLHAGNYTDYAPTKTGSGASGTWGINITGSASNADTLDGYHADSFASASNAWRCGSSSGDANDYVFNGAWRTPNSFANAPIGNGHLWTFNGDGAGNTCVQFSGTYNMSNIYYRSKWYHNEWTNWHTLLSSNNYNYYSPTLTGGGASGTWGINITGSAGSVAWGNVTGKPSLMPGTPGSIELFPGSSAGHGGFIDFHYNNSSSDYTARIINWNGMLQVSGATFNVGGKVELWSDGEGGNIRITSPNGSLWSIDALENSKLRFIWAEAQVPFSFQHDGVFNCAAIATSAWGPSLPGSGYWGQVFFKT